MMSAFLNFLKGPAPKAGLWVRLIGAFVAAHTVETLGREESVLTMLTHRFYYLDVGSGFVIAFVVWSVLALTTQWLDAHCDWDARPGARVCLQLVFGVALPALLVHLLTYLQAVYVIEDSTFFTPSWPQYEFPVCIMIILLANAYYLTLHYYRKAKGAGPSGQPPLTSDESPPPDGHHAGHPATRTAAAPGKKSKQVVLIAKGAKTFPLPLEEVAYFFRQDQHNYVKTFANEVHFLDASLDDIYASLDEELFFKASRRAIINFHACCCYAVLEHGKLEITLKPALDQPLTVSQKVAPAFKAWMDR